MIENSKALEKYQIVKFCLENKYSINANVRSWEFLHFQAIIISGRIKKILKTVMNQTESGQHYFSPFQLV